MHLVTAMYQPVMTKAVSEFNDAGCPCDNIDPPCDCDVSDFNDKDCPCDETDAPCDCDVSTSNDKGCDCDNVDPPCDCDVSSNDDWNCPCDNTDPPCDCNVSDKNDKGCDCDTKQPACDCDESEFNDPDCPCDETDPDNSQYTVSYKNDIQPIWNVYCIECHDQTGGETPLMTSDVSYDKIVPDYITTYNVYQSMIYTQVESGAMPDGKDRIPQELIDLILQWLIEGYPNN